MAKSDYLRDNLLNHTLRNTPYTAPTTVYLAAYTVPPTSAGGGTEVSGGSYVRQTVTFAAPSGGQVVNDAEVLYPIATLDWGTIVAVGIFDAAVAGNFLRFTSLGTPKIINATDQLRFPAGTLVINET
jgi:hypothetical protein